MCCCYILYSKTLGSFYVGFSSKVAAIRCEKHNIQYYGSQKFTAKAKDWQVLLEIPCVTLYQAKKIESHIKKMKSKVYIQNLKKYPEMVSRLLNQYPADS